MKIYNKLTLILLGVFLLATITVPSASATTWGQLNGDKIIAGTSNGGSTVPLPYKIQSGKSCTPVCVTVTLPNGYVAGVPTLVQLDFTLPNRRMSMQWKPGKRYKSTWIKLFGRKKLPLDVRMVGGWDSNNYIGATRFFEMSQKTSIRPRQRRSVKFWVNIPECVTPKTPGWIDYQLSSLRLAADPGWSCNPLSISIRIQSGTLKSKTLRLSDGKKWWWKWSTGSSISQQGAYVYPQP